MPAALSATVILFTGAQPVKGLPVSVTFAEAKATLVSLVQPLNALSPMTVFAGKVRLESALQPLNAFLPMFVLLSKVSVSR